MKIYIGQKLIDVFRGRIKFSDWLYFIKLNLLYGQNTANTMTIMKNKNFKVEKITKEEVEFSIGRMRFVSKVNYPYMMKDVFGDEVYKFKKSIDENRKYTVFDMGANHCYASIYFAEKEWCKDVYAFELIPQNIEYAKKNLSLNDEYIRNKIILNEYGLGNQESTVLAKYFKISDGGCSFNKEFLAKKNKKSLKQSYDVECKVKKTSDILRKIIEGNDIHNDIIIKCDVEGAEYDIFNDLVENYPEIFEKTVKIVGETHLGFDKFYDIVKPYGFSIVWKENGKKLCPFELTK